MNLARLEDEADRYLRAANERMKSEFDIGSFKRYDGDQWRGELVFSNDGVPGVVARIQMVGSISTKSDTWLWSWANPSYFTPLTKAALHVREYGKKHGVKELTEAKWKADEADGWAMTAISARLVEAKGAYRTPGEHGFTFMVITDIARVEDRRVVFPTLTCVHALHQSEPVLHVFRHRDGDVVLVCGRKHGDEELCPIHIAHLLDQDPALIDLADLDPGWRADRDQVGEPWRRSKFEE